ncbi:unnamed protein product [Gadus morhua 'NCC']
MASSALLSFLLLLSLSGMLAQNGGQLPFNLVVVDDLPNSKPMMYSAQRPSERAHDQARKVEYKIRGPKSSNLINDSNCCRRTEPVKINLLDMAQVNFKLVVTADGKSIEYKPTTDCNQILLWALTDLKDSVSNFSFECGSKFGMPPYLTRVTFGNNIITKTENSFWQVLVKNHNMITPVGLCNYRVQDSDVIILRHMTV